MTFNHVVHHPPSIGRCKADYPLGKNDMPNDRDLWDTGQPTSILTDSHYSLRIKVNIDLLASLAF